MAKLKKKTNSTNFMKKKIWNFHLYFGTFILRPIGQWANLIVSSVAMCSELSNATSYIPLLQFSEKLCNFALTPSRAPRQRSACPPPTMVPAQLTRWLGVAWGRWTELNWKHQYRCRYDADTLPLSYLYTRSPGMLVGLSLLVLWKRGEPGNGGSLLPCH